jgi:hypothetical protein
MRWKIKITLEDGRSCIIDEMATLEGLKMLFMWYQHHTDFFNGTISMWDSENECEVI